MGRIPCKLMSDSEYSVIKSDVIKRFDCICNSSTKQRTISEQEILAG